MQQMVTIDDELLDHATQCLSVNDVNKVLSIALRELILHRTSSVFFTVNVTVSENRWMAECKALGLVAKADSYNQLLEKAQQSVSELIQSIAPSRAARDIRLQFIHQDKQASEEKHRVESVWKGSKKPFEPKSFFGVSHLKNIDKQLEDMRNDWER